MRAEIKRLDCVLDYEATELEKALEGILERRKIKLSKPFYNKNHPDFTISRKAKTKSLRITYDRSLENKEDSPYSVYSNNYGYYGYGPGADEITLENHSLIPILNKITSFNDPEYFYEFLGIQDTKRKAIIGEISFIIAENKIYDFFNFPQGTENEKFIKYILGRISTDISGINKMTLSQIKKELIKKEIDWHLALKFIISSIKHYDDFLNIQKYEI